MDDGVVVTEAQSDKGRVALLVVSCRSAGSSRSTVAAFSCCCGWVSLLAMRSSSRFFEEGRCVGARWPMRGRGGSGRGPSRVTGVACPASCASSPIVGLLAPLAGMSTPAAELLEGAFQEVMGAVLTGLH